MVLPQLRNDKDWMVVSDPPAWAKLNLGHPRPLARSLAAIYGFESTNLSFTEGDSTETIKIN